MHIQAQAMTKKDIKLSPHYKVFRKFYPYRDLKLAVNIIRILASNSKLSSKAIRTKLDSMYAGHAHKSIQTALERLKDTGYVIKDSIFHKSQTDNMWELSCVGNIASLIIINDDEIDSLINQHKEEKFYKMINFLIKSSKKDLVELLIDRLNEIKNDHLEIETIATKWYNDMRLKISTMDASSFSELIALQEKIKRYGFDPIKLIGRGHITDLIFREKRIDRICSGEQIFELQQPWDNI